MAIVSRVALGEKEVQVTHPTEKVPKPRQPVGESHPFRVVAKADPTEFADLVPKSSSDDASQNTTTAASRSDVDFSIEPRKQREQLEFQLEFLYRS